MLVDYSDSADDEESFIASNVEAAFEKVNALRREVLSLTRHTSTSAYSDDRAGPPPAVDDRVEWGYRLCARECFKVA